MIDDLFAGPAVDLETVLAAREARVARRLEVFTARHQPAVSISPVMPGPVKNCRASRSLRDAALDALLPRLVRRGWRCEVVEVVDAPTGPEALVSVAADPMALKRAVVALEDRHQLGRLWDLDVIDPIVGGISRPTLGFAPRSCFVCDRPAHACARSRAHTLDELLAAMKAVIDAARLSFVA